MKYIRKNFKFNPTKDRKILDILENQGYGGQTDCIRLSIDILVVLFGDNVNIDEINKQIKINGLINVIDSNIRNVKNLNHIEVIKT